MLLLHGTADDNAERIAKPGFDVRLTKRALYGHGVYLAMLMKTSRKMCSRICNHFQMHPE